MFTGIIQETGLITSINKDGDWIVTVAAHQTAKGLNVGASVSCNGICLTALHVSNNEFVVQISSETLEKTNAPIWKEGTSLNLERSLCVGDELGGHLVTGHVDGIAELLDRREDKDSVRMSFRVPHDYSTFLAPKGSITLDGVSLTINQVTGSEFCVNIIPHTQDVTTIGKLHVGDMLNFEVDIISRYVGRMLAARGFS